MRMKLDRIYLRKKVEDVTKLKQNVRVMNKKNIFNEKDEYKNKTIVHDNINTEYNLKDNER